MSELKFSKKVLKLNLYGDSMELSYPSVGQFLEYEEKMNDAKEDPAKSAEMLFSFLERCGLPKDKALGMDQDDLTALVEHLRGAKKK